MVLSTLVWLAAARAEVVTVSSPDELEQALVYGTADVIEVTANLVADGDWLGECITVSRDLTLQGHDGATFRVPPLIVEGAAVSLSDLAIAGGCFVELASGRGTVTRARVGVTAREGAALTATGVLWQGQSGQLAHGLYVEDATAALHGSSFQGLLDTAVMAASVNASIDLAFEDTDFLSNAATGAADLDVMGPGSLTLLRGSFVGLGDAYASLPDHGAMHLQGVDATITETAFTDYQGQEAGLASVQSGDSGIAATLTVMGARFSDIEGADSGGVFDLVDVDEARFTSVHFEDITGNGEGGVIKARGVDHLTVNRLALHRYSVKGTAGAFHLLSTSASFTQSFFCDGAAGERATSGLEGMVFHLQQSSSLTLENSVIAGLDDRGLGIDLIFAKSSEVHLTNNTFDELGVAAVLRMEVGSSLSFVNNLFHEVDGVLVTAVDGVAPDAYGYSLFDGMFPYNGDLDFSHAGDVWHDPEFVEAWTRRHERDDPCEVLPVLTSASPAVDAGDPTLLDPDRSRSDIGAFGGPDRLLPDVDGDGAWTWEDCDDNDAGRRPGLGEVAHDGVDQDCDGADLIDGDGDGWVGWQSGGEDCNDLAADVKPDGVEVACDGVDQDCDGADLCEDGDTAADDRSLATLSGGCGAPGPVRGAWALALGLIAWRRRAWA